MVYLDEHLKKYPLMTTQDVVKLFMQGIMGPAHLVGLLDDVVCRVTAEYEDMKDNGVKYDLVEKVSDLYSRVYLKPFFEKFGTFLPLAKAFKESALEGDISALHRALNEIKHNFDTDFIDRYISSGRVLISHSETYRNNYHPHYLVVANKLITDLIGE